MSTNLALLELVEELTSSMDNKNKTIGVFIDLKKAFDTIDHDIVRGISNNWVNSYLTGLNQYVNIDIATYIRYVTKSLWGATRISTWSTFVFIVHK